MIIEIMRCSAEIRIPRTPRETRPIERTSVSGNRMTLPTELNSMMSDWPSVKATPTS